MENEMRALIFRSDLALLSEKETTSYYRHHLQLRGGDFLVLLLRIRRFSMFIRRGSSTAVSLDYCQ